MPLAIPAAATTRQADARRLLTAFHRAQAEQPPELTRRFGIINLSWVSVESLGARGPRVLEALVAEGYVRRHPRCPEIGRVTPAGAWLLACLRSSKARRELARVH